MRGSITNYIDVAQIVLYAFWAFFVGLIIYLRREDKREGYPLESDRTDRTNRVQVQGFPAMPAPKTFRLAHGGSVTVPSTTPDRRTLNASPVEAWPGAPLRPTGNPMLEGVGPAAYAERSDQPDLTFEGHLRIVPLRVATDHTVESRDPDPRGMPVLGADGVVGGTVADVWVDRAEPQIRYLEVAIGGGTRTVLLPYGFAKYDVGRHLVNCASITAAQFANVPGLRNADEVTRLEEDKIQAYYGGGTLYATPDRFGPLV